MSVRDMRIHERHWSPVGEAVAMGNRLAWRASPTRALRGAKRSQHVMAVLFLVVGLMATAIGQDDVGELEEQAIRRAVDVVAPSVVRIETFGGRERVGETLVGEGPTTGLVVGQDGWILSSAFHFAQQPNSILVVLPDGRRLGARLVARDRSRMLVLLKVDPDRPLPTPELAPVDQLSVGQWVVAVGRTFDPQRANLSVGILSAKDRIWGRAVQTDAKVSPSNYGGPLIDLQGRVIGILVPLSPEGDHELAGTEWYDSGIGFAVPLHDVLAHLSRLQEGEDLFPGLLGVTFEGQNIYADKPEIATVHPRSPAEKAGIQPGDVIVSVGGQPVERQVHVKHALGPRYAGETVRVEVQRKDQRLSVDVQLTDQLQPYQHPFVGILPARNGNGNEQGVGVRYVYPGSPADEAGVAVGDRILQLAGQVVGDASALRTAVAHHEPGETVAVKVEREGQNRDVTVTLGTLPETLPDDLPVPSPAEDEKIDAKDLVSLKVPDMANEGWLMVPPAGESALPRGLLVHLPTPGKFDRDAFAARWGPWAVNQQTIVLALTSHREDRWELTELEYIRKAINMTIQRYSIDPDRIVVHGYQTGGALAGVVAFRMRDRIRGAVLVDAALPRMMGVPTNEPLQRLAFHVTVFSQSPWEPRVTAMVESLRRAKYPVTENQRDEAPRPLSARELAELFRWLDALDRI